MNFVAGERADLIGGNLGQRDGLSVISGELHRKSAAILAGMNDRAHVAGGQSVFRQRDLQRHAIEFSDHAGKG